MWLGVGTVLVCGTLAEHVGCAGVCWYCPVWVWKAGAGVAGVCCTLLGPEGSVTVWRLSWACLVLLLCVVVWVCVVFENFTVDASIFVDFDKLLSAIGGCLGTKSR